METYAVSRVIQARRKALGLTLEQVGSALGVTASAVYKWEQGSNCPDIGLLSPLARLLKTDLNTLMGFSQEISREALEDFCRELRDIAERENFAAALARMEEMLHCYPNSETLLFHGTLQLQTLLMSADLETGEREQYENRLNAWYLHLSESEEDTFSNTANFMLAGSALKREDWTAAEGYLNRLPEIANQPDARLLKSSLLLGQDRKQEAIALLQQGLLSRVGQVQAYLFRLSDAYQAMGDAAAAAEVSQRMQNLIESFDLGPLNAAAASFTLEAEGKEAEGQLPFAKRLLSALLTPWQPADSPLYRYIPGGGNSSDGRALLQPLLAAFKQEPVWESLCHDPEARALLEQLDERLKGDREI